MMRKSLFAALGCGSMLCGAIYFQHAYGQSPVGLPGRPGQDSNSAFPRSDTPRPEKTPNNPFAPNIPNYPNPIVPGMPSGFMNPNNAIPQPYFQPPMAIAPDGRVAMAPEVREALHKLRSPDLGESEKTEAKTAIRDFLTEAFEKDLKARKAQVARVEEQLDRLKKQLERRQEAQDKIIDLRMQLLENEADGLSFPDSWTELQPYHASEVHASPMFVPGNPGYVGGNINHIPPAFVPSPSATPVENRLGPPDEAGIPAPSVRPKPNSTPKPRTARP